MDAAEYDERLTSLLEEVPQEFRAVIGEMAYEAGHPAGWGECIIEAQHLVESLEPAIKEYEKAVEKAIRTNTISKLENKDDNS